MQVTEATRIREDGLGEYIAEVHPAPKQTVGWTHVCSTAPDITEITALRLLATARFAAEPLSNVITDPIVFPVGLPPVLSQVL